MDKNKFIRHMINAGLFLGLTLNMTIVGRADQGSYEEIQQSTQQLNKDWDAVTKEYSQRFKKQLDLVSQKIDELKNAVDNGDPDKRKEINSHLARLKESRDQIRKLIHEITAASVVKLSSLQKYFINAKDDTK